MIRSGEPIRLLMHVQWFAMTAVLLVVTLAWTGLARAQSPAAIQLGAYGLFPEIVVYPRHAGKPDPRWREFNWRYMDQKVNSSKYRLFFYDTETWAASLVTPLIREEILDLGAKFDYHPSQRFDYILFTSLQDFRQANIFDISEGVQGITSTEEATMALPYTGDLDAFRHVSQHEMVHQFQVQKSKDLDNDNSNLGLIPLWFIEGMAEYYSLHGLGPEAEYYMRDLVFNENQKEEYLVPGLFEEGPLSFITVYKVGQAKIAFFEDTFGLGTIQKIYSALLRPQDIESQEEFFKKVTSLTLNVPPEQLEEQWRAYVGRIIARTSQNLTQSFDDYTEISATGDTLDDFRVSPNGRFIVTRELEPTKGVVSLTLFDTVAGYRRIPVAQDSSADLISLYFMQIPIMAISNDYVAYIVQTIQGPAIEYRRMKPADGSVELGRPERITMRKLDVLQASSLALSQDGRLAFVGLSSRGWPNIYVVDLNASTPMFRQLTDDPHLYQDLAWAKVEEGQQQSWLLLSSNRTADAKKNIFAFNVDSREFMQLSAATTDQQFPSGAIDDFVFQSMQSGSPQILRRTKDKEVVLTSAKTMLSHSSYVDGKLRAIGLKGGRFRLYEIPPGKFLTQPAPEQLNLESARRALPWQPILVDFPPDAVKKYKPFRTSGVRVDDIAGFLSTGGLGGIVFSLSDLMRNYGIAGQIQTFDSLRYTNGNVVFSNRNGRSVWALGAYRSVAPRIDTTFSEDQSRTFYYSEFGGLIAWQYPLGVFSYFELSGRAGYAERFNFSDPTLRAEWEALTPQHEPVLSPTVRVGYDEILYEIYTGPISGWSVLLESQPSYFPNRGAVNHRLRIDGSYYVPIRGRTVLGFEALAATVSGDPYSDSFLLSGDDILRTYVFGDNRLLGRQIAAAKAELWVPFGELFRFRPLRMMAAYDAGTVSPSTSQLDDNFTMSGSVGIGLNLPPIGLNFIWSWPLQTPDDVRINSPVLHFTLRYLYY